MHKPMSRSSLGLFLLVLHGFLAEAVVANPVPLPTLQPSTTPYCIPARDPASPKQTEFASLILNVVVYAPIALYSENLRVSSALQDVFEYPTFGHSSSQVVSLRHGNTFALVNAAVLENAALIKRGLSPQPPKQRTDAASAFRPTAVNITFLTPTLKQLHSNHTSDARRFWLSYTVTFLELLALLLAAAFLAFEGVYLGAVILGCLFASTAVLAFLQHLSKPIFANQASVKKDTRMKASEGAAVDVHIVAANCNASELDVLIGYSSQLHALTNIPMRTDSPHLMLWMARGLAVVLVTQASLLAASATRTHDSGSGSRSDQTNAEAWGSLCWLICYLLMLVPPRLFKSRLEDSLLDTQPFIARRLPSLVFGGRKDALCFITGLPASLRETVGRWDWVDAFMPPNARRREWETATGRAHARIKAAASETPLAANGLVLSANPQPSDKVTEWEENLYKNMHAAFGETGFKDALTEFLRETGLSPPP
ncbi:hypothetical protein BDW74DRAFT_180316 [Aspergillus multicolor]|uniref:uncharacterized protein n=1 Tax=Aspergillus multicolor TaxID=41759 RepID=UPI003CCD737B